jgi:hypothetical protein
MFADLRDEADEYFSKLPAPVPTRDRVNAEYTAAHGGGGAAAVAAASQAAAARARAAPPVSMSRYNCSSAPCFAGHCTVATPNGPRRVSELAKGDSVLVPACTMPPPPPPTTTAGTTTAATATMATATVVCVVVTPCASNTAFFVEFPGGLSITPYHPVRLNGRWQHSQETHAVVMRPCDAVYNLVLDTGHVVVVDGVECVTLGHGLDDGDGGVLRHAYLGTHRVVDDLRACDGWASGRVRVKHMVRGTADGGALVSGLVECDPNDIV